MTDVVAGALILLLGQIVMDRLHRSDAKAARKESKEDAAALLSASERIEHKVDGAATAQAAKIDELHRALDAAAKLDASKSAQIAQGDRVLALTDAQLDAAKDAS